MSILLSIVSHKQADLVHGLLMGIERFCLYKDIEVVVTSNVQEKYLLRKMISILK